MTYTQNWHGRHIENWNKYVVPNVPKDSTCLEIGCFEGMSTVWICENLKPILLDVVDTFAGSEEHVGMRISSDGLYDRFIENTEKYRNTIAIYKETSFEFLTDIISGTKKWVNDRGEEEK